MAKIISLGVHYFGKKNRLVTLILFELWLLHMIFSPVSNSSHHPLVCDVFSFVFWKKLKIPKRHFKISWPLHKVLRTTCYTWFDLPLQDISYQHCEKNWEKKISKHHLIFFFSFCWFWLCLSNHSFWPSLVDTVQDFLIKLGIKPGMHLWEISILSLDNVIVRSTKIMKRADKNWAHF